MGLLFTGLIQGNHFVLLGWDRQSRLAVENEDLDAVDRTLRRLIVQARPGSESEPLSFSGTAHAVTFTSTVPLPSAGLLTQRADIELRVDGSHRLMLIWTPHWHAIRMGQPPTPEATEILRGVERLELAYWPARQDGGWTPAWADSVPPRLVRVGLVFADARHLRWPDILIATQVGVTVRREDVLTLR